MRMIRHVSILALGAALALGAQALPSLAADDEQGEHHHHMNAEDRAALLDARIAALKTGLKLTGDQEKNWAPLEAAIRQQAKERADRFAAWRKEERSDDGDKPHDLLDRLQERSKHMIERASRLQTLVAAAKPLYNTLDDGQKLRFSALLRATAWHRRQGSREG